jgi:PKD repeat protein
MNLLFFMLKQKAHSEAEDMHTTSPSCRKQAGPFFITKIRSVRYTIILISLLFSSRISAQCPQVYDYLNNLSSKPYFISCTGGAYLVNFKSNSSWGTYTLNWGDNTAPVTATGYTANTIIPHTYTATIDTFIITLTIPANSCTMIGIVVMEKPVNAAISVPAPGLTLACAPRTLTFTNSSTDVSPTTTFTWDYGDNTANVVNTFTNGGQNVTHLYSKNTVSCQTQVTLRARNYCSFGVTSVANYNPIKIFDKDDAVITPDKISRCWPDNVFSFTNTTTRNCLAEGNSFQRKESWNFGNYWGLGRDSIINWSSWPPATTQTIAFPSVGFYTVMLRDSSFCGIDTAYVSVVIINAPIAAVTTPTSGICQNVPVTFTNSSSPGFSYRWNAGQGGGFVNLGGGNKTFTYSTPGTYTVQIIALISSGGPACTDTAATVITVNAPPTASFAMSPAYGCNSVAVSFTNLSTGSVSWNWNFASLSTSTLQTPPAQTFSGTGTYITTLTAVSAAGCSNTRTASIIVHPNPQPAFTQFTVCQGSSITFTNSSTTTGTNAITGYTWDFGDNFTSTVSAPAHTYIGPGSYVVKLKAKTAFCTDSISQPILSNVRPTATFVITSTTGCTPFTPVFTNQSLNATTYQWYSGAGAANTSTATNASFTYTNGSQAQVNYTASLVAFSTAGCKDSVSKVVSVKHRPVASFTTNAIAACSPMSITFSNTTTGGSQYAWQFGDGGNSSQFSPSHTYTNLSVFTQIITAELIVTNSVGCTDTARQQLSVYPQALTAFTMLPSKGCTPLLVTFNSLPGISSYTWTHGDGTPDFTTTAAHTWTYTNSTATNQALTVRLIGETANGCTGTSTSVVQVYRRPVPGFTMDAVKACAPMIVTFTNTTIGADSYAWTFDNGLSSSAQDPSTTYTNIAGDALKTFTVKLVANTIENCADSITGLIQLAGKPKAGFTADTPACAPRIITFTNASAGASTYQWTFGDGGTSAAANPTHAFVNVAAGDKSFLVKLVAMNADNCVDSANMQVTLHGKPVFNIAASPDSGCAPLNVRFFKITGAVESSWSYDGIAFGASTDFNHRFDNSSTVNKTYKVTVIAKDQYNCSDTAEKTIRVYPRPVASFAAGPLMVYAPTQSVGFTNQSTGASQYSWDFGDGGTSKEKSPSYFYKTKGEYKVSLIAISTKGCRDTFDLADLVIVLQETSLQMPNAFTPNTAASPGNRYNPNDLSNDIFHPVVRGAESYELSVYSRWGELLYNTANLDEGWDGYYRGDLCTQGIYIWKVSVKFLDGSQITKTGDVLLMR